MLLIEESVCGGISMYGERPSIFTFSKRQIENICVTTCHNHHLIILSGKVHTVLSNIQVTYTVPVFVPRTVEASEMG